MSRRPFGPHSPGSAEGSARSPGDNDHAALAAVIRWLDANPASPPALRARMNDAISQVPLARSGLGPPEILAEASLVCLRAVLNAVSPKRAAATDLLAADALLTHACEAASVDGVSALEALAQKYGPRTLAALLPEER